MSMPVRLLVAAWLALAFPLGQQQALLHALDHAASQGAGNDEAPVPEKCADHSLYVPFAGALGACSQASPPAPACNASIASRDAPCAPLPGASPYRSRAPPAPPAFA